LLDGKNHYADAYSDIKYEVLELSRLDNAALETEIDFNSLSEINDT